jgi:hypothetical protein
MKNTPSVSELEKGLLELYPEVVGALQVQHDAGKNQSSKRLQRALMVIDWVPGAGERRMFRSLGRSYRGIMSPVVAVHLVAPVVYAPEGQSGENVPPTNSMRR